LFLLSFSIVSKHIEKQSSRFDIVFIAIGFFLSFSLSFDVFFHPFEETTKDAFSLFQRVIRTDASHSIFLYVFHVGIFVSLSFA
jgi:hypothetical protein